MKIIAGLPISFDETNPCGDSRGERRQGPVPVATREDPGKAGPGDVGKKRPKAVRGSGEAGGAGRRPPGEADEAEWDAISALVGVGASE
ncbi:MAG: hypothetical protein ACM3NF_07785 [Gemmatimonadota bacterium]